MRGFGKTAVPSIIGHESTGRVSALGDGVLTDVLGNSVSAGDRIVYPYFKNCGKCHSCLSKELAMVECENRLGLSGGISSAEPPHFNGAFAEYLYLRPGWIFFKVPDELSDEVVTPLNCALSTIIHGVTKIGGVPPGGTVVIQGAGALGLYASAYTKESGADRVIVIDKVKERLEMVRRFGADHTVNIEEVEGQDERVEEVLKLNGGVGADLVIEVSGAPDVMPEGLKMLRKGGRYLEIGSITTEARSTIDVFLIAFRELKIMGNMNYDAWVIPQAMSFLLRTQDKYPLKELITQRFGLEQINEAFEMAASRRGERVAIVP
jgi:threonine dehydrogenase-like Zn-dependent dehydrogenase